MPTRTPSAYVSRPAIIVDGADKPDISLDVLSALVEETTEGLYRCEITLSNYGSTDAGGADYRYFGRDKLDFGSQIELRLGPGDPPEIVFEGTITALEAHFPPDGASRLVVLAEDRFQDLRMTRRSRAFEDLSDSDIIQQIASDHGLTADVDFNGPTHRAVAQVNLSDLAFIRQRARSAGVELWVEGDTLFARARGDRNGAAITLTYGINLIAFSVRADLAHQCTELHVTGWDVDAKDTIDESADDAEISEELDGNEGGSAILFQTFGERIATVVHTVPLTSEEARVEAASRYQERARRFVTGTAIADGDPQFRVGRVATLSGVGPLFDGDYVVVRARHTYDLTYGYRTDLDVERAGLGGA